MLLSLFTKSLLRRRSYRGKILDPKICFNNFNEMFRK